MFTPNYPKAGLGLEHDCATALALQKEGRGRWGIRQAATVGLPDGLLTPSFLERNVSDIAEMRSALEEVCLKAGLGGQRKWSVSLPGNTARTAILTLETEPASKKELADVLDWKAENSFGAPAREMRLSMTPVSADRDGRRRFVATAVKLEVLDEYESLFESMRWQAGLVLPRALSEANWLMGAGQSDSLLISSQNDGFTALLLRGGEPVVVRNVTCSPDETDDEVFRLLMFYNDRLASVHGDTLGRVMVVGRDIDRRRILEISNEALGRELTILRPEDVGLWVPSSDLSFDDLAAPAGIAALGA